MQLSAQLASNLAALLLIFPMYFLGRFFFERRVAFWGTLLYQYLPVSGQHLSDGVSEALFLLLTSTPFCVPCGHCAGSRCCSSSDAASFAAWPT